MKPAIEGRQFKVGDGAVDFHIHVWNPTSPYVGNIERRGTFDSIISIQNPNACQFLDHANHGGVIQLTHAHLDHLLE